MQMFIRAGILCVIGFLAASPAAQAAFHRYDIKEVFSNSDGSVQFVEMFTPNNNQQNLDAHTIVASQDTSSNTFTFVGSGPTPTGNQHLLIANAAFEAACGITPDFILPDNFLFDPDGTVNFGPGASVVSYTTLPLDGEMSVNYPGETTATNSPTNHAEDTCSLRAPGGEVPSLGTCGLGVLATLMGVSGWVLRKSARLGELSADSMASGQAV